mmetsp:Transcript_27246/g.58319  ORF Transcript_27246/g.58319 Transcript_27246/m.58319 type:complete len:85 (+) Transcript_27246:854-1108(+)
MHLGVPTGAGKSGEAGDMANALAVSASVIVFVDVEDGDEDEGGDRDSGRWDGGILLCSGRDVPGFRSLFGGIVSWSILYTYISI